MYDVWSFLLEVQHFATIHCINDINDICYDAHDTWCMIRMICICICKCTYMICHTWNYMWWHMMIYIYILINGTCYLMVWNINIYIYTHINVYIANTTWVWVLGGWNVEHVAYKDLNVCISPTTAIFEGGVIGCKEETIHPATLSQNRTPTYLW